jgi:hypothetical protein
MLRYASHVACLHVLSACAGAQNPVSALNSNASSLPPLQCDHFVTQNFMPYDKYQEPKEPGKLQA